MSAMAGNSSFREIAERMDMLSIVAQKGEGIVNTSYSNNAVENMSIGRMREHVPDELEDLNRRLVEIDSQTSKNMIKMKDLHEEMEKTMQGIARLRRERLDIEQDIEVISTNHYMTLGANIAVYQAAQSGFDAGMGDTLPRGFRVRGHSGHSGPAASSDSRSAGFAPPQRHHRGAPSTPPQLPQRPPAPPGQAGAGPRWPTDSELREHRASNRIFMPPLDQQKDHKPRGRGAAGHRFAISEADIIAKRRTNSVQLADLMPDKIVDIQDLFEAKIATTVWIKSVNNMLGEEEFVYRILTCDNRFPLYGTHISGYKIGYRFEPDYDEEVYSGIMYVGCANEDIADRFVQYWDNRQFERHGRLRVQAEIASRPLCRDMTMGNRARTPGYTRTTWEEIWALRMDAKRRKDMQ